MSTPRSRVRVAIIGLGPKGLFALERLVARSLEADGASVKVDIFEPHPVPGAGPNYDPSQPGYLLMNFDAAKIDMWPDREGPSYLDWCAADGHSPPSYPSRADVGRYLSEGYSSLVERGKPIVDVHLHPTLAGAVTQCEDGWRIHSDSRVSEHDEVLVTVGHANDWAGRLEPSTDGPPVVPSVFPVEHWLTRERVAPGATVGVRGFALTAIDACLALTEGRGGSFAERSGPYDLEYRSGPDEVGGLLPFTRTGRPMLAKPDPQLGPRAEELEPISEAGRAEVRDSPGVGALGRILERVAERSLQEVAQKPARVDLHGLSSAQGDPVAELERSLRVAVGEATAGADWAIGHAWRGVYPAIVERFGRDGIGAEEWPEFRALAYEMERVAFGPPPENAAKLLALIRAGKVETAHLRGGTSGPEVDVIVDAVLPPPGALAANHPLMDQLVEDGFARVADGRRGLEVTADITCVGANGGPSAGLAAIGRPTEDWIIGNDTLSRHLHAEPDRWARRVIERASA